MPFKSEKQRKWMHANEPEMADKWEKEEESVNEAISWEQLKTFLLGVTRSGAKKIDGKRIEVKTAKAILDYGNSGKSKQKKLEKLPIKN